MTNFPTIDNQEMELAWRFVAETSTSVFLTGKAGTGKTTFLRRLREEVPKRMVVLAPTGVAAINAQGQTIHSFFQLPLGPMVPGGVRKEQGHYRMGKDKKNLIRTLDLLVIDEISMVRCDVLDAVDAELRKYRDRTKPFGGVQLLLIGDLQQLAPVAVDHEWDILRSYYSTPYFYGSLALQQTPYVTIELKHIYRQQDAEFINLLAKIRSNSLDAGALQMLNARYVANFTPEAGEDWIRLTTHNRTAQQYNESQLEALPSRAYNFRAEVHKNFPESSYPADEILTLKKGAQVMFIKNDPSSAHEYYNGKIGLVHEFQDEGIVVYCKEDESYTVVPRLTWENTKYTMDPDTKEIREEVEGTFTQYPLRLAWAITVHKSQGLTFDHAVLDINASFTHGQVYVALSRCRTLQGLVLSSPLSPSSIIMDRNVGQYMNDVLSRSEETVSHFPELRQAYLLQLLDEMFDFRPLQRSYEHLQRVVEEHLYNSRPEFLNILRLAHPRFVAEIVNIGLRFQQEYRHILASHEPQPAHLQERIHAAIGYFLPRIHEVLDEVFESTAIRIENKAVSTQYSNALEQLSSTFALQVGVLSRMAKQDFSIKVYLQSKAQAALDGDPLSSSDTRAASKAKAKPAPEKPKRKKGDTNRKSLEMLQSGLTIPQIAAERELRETTIAGHLTPYIRTGEVTIDQLVSPLQQRIIRELIQSQRGAYSYNDLIEKLPKDVPAYAIRLVEADIEASNNF